MPLTSASPAPEPEGQSEAPSDRGSTASAWKKLVSELELEKRLADADVPVVVSAVEIKALTGREPRLMTKFDTRESRPEALKGLTILPVTNGEYALLAGDGYADVPLCRSASYKSFSARARTLASLPWQAGPASESQAIDMAHASGLLDEFFGDETRLTVRGRLRTPRFDFEFDAASGAVPLRAEGVQVEVDAGFEGETLHLLEAKLGTRNNFHVRQLYYPLRMWRVLLPQKPVSAAFLSWSNRCLSLRRYVFDPLERYHALQLSAAVDYYLDEPQPIPSLPEVLAATREDKLPEGMPFPQADDLRRVIDIVDAVAQGVSSHEDLARRYEFDLRQAQYYGNAAAFLGLVTRTPAGFELDEAGADFARLPRPDRQTLLLRRIASLPIFREVIERLVTTGELESSDVVAELIEQKANLRGQTTFRRARTVLAWVRWCQSLSETPPAADA
jgi:hypothetical protein